LSRDLVNSLQANAIDATMTLREIMQDKKASVTARVTAAGKLLDLSLRAREQLELEERLEALERVLKQRKGKK
jgi:ABC-type antimicrobial peptide transport system ATPase subunit